MNVFIALAGVIGMWVFIMALLLIIMSKVRKPQKNIICSNPNCCYRGLAESKAKGSFLIFIILLCFGFLPGILYWIFCSGYKYSCPQCGCEICRD